MSQPSNPAVERDSPKAALSFGFPPRFALRLPLTSTLGVMNTQHHTSPDGRLQLVVVRDGTDIIIIGFEGTPSHTHGNLLVGEYAAAGIELGDAEAAARPIRQ